MISFGKGLRLTPDGTLRKRKASIHLPPKEHAALCLLLDNAGEIVSQTQMKHAVWPDVHVGPESIPRSISSLRARLGPDVNIQTLYKRGYRVDGEVRRTIH